MTTLAGSLRSSLADLLEEVGPDAPTLCAGWATRDLAAHLVLRERRPDAALGIAVRAFAGHMSSVQNSLAAEPWPRLVDKVRNRSVLLISPVDSLFNTTEYFVHLEDVRRAELEWKPAPEDPELEESLWRQLRQRGRAFFRRSPVGVILELPDGQTHVAAEGEPVVTLVGPASELTLYAYGRGEQALVEIQGPADAIDAFRGTSLGI
jgi:uncharacterized protein (TIGR03085 family)